MVKDILHSSTSLSGSKRIRPPRVDLARTVENKISPVIPHSPVLLLEGNNSAFEETLQLTDSDTSDSEVKAGASSTSRLKVPSSVDDLLPEDISKDLAALHQLRQNVKKNLKLRPIRSRSNLPKVNLDIDGDIESVISKPFFSGFAKDTASSVSQVYGADPPQSALSPISAISSYFTPVEATPFSALFSNRTTNPSSSTLPSLPISPRTLYEQLSAPLRPLLIDTRVLATYQSFHLRHSVNIAIPSLILKRCRKPGGGLHSLDSLRQFITTEQATTRWNLLMAPGGPWDGNVVVYDDEMNPKDRDSTAWSIIPVLQPLLNNGTISYLEGGLSKAGHDPDLRKLIINGDEKEDETSDDFSSFQPNIHSAPPSYRTTTGATLNGRKASLGLFQLDTQAALRSKQLPEIEPSSTTSTNPSSPLLPPSSLPVMPLATSSPSHSSRSPASTDSPSLGLSASAATPSPPPSSIGFRKPQPARRPSVPNLRRLDTKSAERLRDVPKLSVRTKPMRSATLAVPPTLSLNILAPPHSPTRLNLKHSNHAPSPTRICGKNPLSPTSDPANYLTPYYTPPHTPRVHRADDLPEPPRTPLTARPDLEPPTTDDSFPLFTISTILPNFLYLGPELTTPEHVEELRGLGVRRILNIAAECDDDNGLKLREVFEKYFKIPMRDTVEEDNIARGVREVCDILDDARLHSAPTYVHCKAGKSRSVTAVMAYLIHANHWTLSQAYAFVLERRKGISPNIGFVSELMSFEEQELGGKSIGVQPTLGSSTLNSGSVPQKSGENATSTNGSTAEGSTFNIPDPSYPIPSLAGANHLRRGGHHVRESLPSMEAIVPGAGGPMSAVEGQTRALLGDSGQEMEVKDSTGRYRHARRAPVDENTLQPMRRVSKAGLESFGF